MKKVIQNLIIFLIILLAFTLIFTANWLYKTFGNLTLNEIVFQLKVPMDGSNTDFYYNYAQNALPYILLCTFAVFIVVSLIFKQKKYKPQGKHAVETMALVKYNKFRIKHKYAAKLVISILLLVISLVYVCQKTDFTTYMYNQYISNSNLIEDEYVDPRNVNIQFGENKRNLIYIYLESMEETYFSKEDGGAYDQSLIPELEELAKENTSFSASSTVPGLYCLSGTTWTSGAMVAQTSGLPLKIPIESNSYGAYTSFLPGVYNLGQVLEKQGYKQMLMVGSDAIFGGRSHLFKQHGNYDIYEFYTAVNEGKKQVSDRVWWGFDDKDLVEYAKEKITSLAEQDQPFNFTMLTADTHHPDGYLCEDCQNLWGVQYYNVLSCSSKRIKEFVDWIQQQDFYENTTIVICGDHISMQHGTFDFLNDTGYTRSVYNVIINPAIQAENTQNKECATIDMFPTTLASLGATIDGDKLALGTNLFSDKQTLVGKYGLDYVNKEFDKNSKFYNKQFLY